MIRVYTFFRLFCCVSVLGFLMGCSAVQKSMQHDFGDNVYRVLNDPGLPARAYLAWEADTLRLYALDKNRQVDAATFTSLPLPETHPTGDVGPYHFRKSGVDLDFVTIPVRFRPGREGVPNQLNSNLNGAIYAGYRTDHYRFRYQKTPVSGWRRELRQFGYDYGAFAGIGTVPINPTVTLDRITQEYDGLVYSTGLAAFVGIDQFGFGLGLGWDFLLDGNREHWVYQEKPWLGVMVAINLN